MRTEYKRDMNHNYLILTGDERIDTDSYQVRMIVANAVPDLLQCRIQGIDGKFMVYYDITSRHSMTALFEEKRMDLESLQVILCPILLSSGISWGNTETVSESCGVYPPKAGS